MWCLDHSALIDMSSCGVTNLSAPPPIQVFMNLQSHQCSLSLSPTKETELRKRKLTLFNAARLMTFTPILSALRMASSIWSLIPSLAKGRKYCKRTYQYNTNLSLGKSRFGGELLVDYKINVARAQIGANLEPIPWDCPELVQPTPKLVERDQESFGPSPHLEHHYECTRPQPQQVGLRGEWHRPEGAENKWYMDGGEDIHHMGEEDELRNFIILTCILS